MTTLTYPAPLSDSAQPRTKNPFLRKVPLAVWLVALGAALLSIAPHWNAQRLTPPGWTFNHNTTINPDVMQYRVWMRQAVVEGPLVSNAFTAEPNSQHLPVFFYYVLGSTAQALDLQPEAVYAYAGSILAFVLTVLLFVIVRHFMANAYQTWVIFLTILLGGGLGAYLRWAGEFAAIRNNLVFKRLVWDAIGDWEIVTFSDSRGQFIFNTLHDTHFLIIYIFMLLAVFSLYLTLRHFSLGRLSVTTVFFVASTMLHVYQGVNLLAITAGVAVIFWHKKMITRQRLVAFCTVATAVTICMAFWLYLLKSSGLPISLWRGVPTLLSILIIAFPLAWYFIARGFASYWKEAGFQELFLTGWAAGLLFIILSGPFYPYPDRGTMTFSIVLYLIAGGIFFSRHRRVSPRLAVIAIVLLIGLPAYSFWVEANLSFSPEETESYLTADHLEFIQVLQDRAGRADVLLAGPTDLLWLGPEHPGKHYAGHWFLTVDYESKQQRFAQFWESPPDEQRAFLEQNNIRFIFADEHRSMLPVDDVPGLALLKHNPEGSLYVFNPDTPETAQR